MQPLEISINQLARDLAVPPARVHGIVHGQRAITADTALRLAVYFGMQPQTWIGMQAEYDLRVARLNAWKAISKSVKPRKAA